jgi:hypothetical protein
MPGTRPKISLVDGQMGTSIEKEPEHARASGAAKSSSERDDPTRLAWSTFNIDAFARDFSDKMAAAQDDFEALLSRPDVASLAREEITAAAKYTEFQNIVDLIVKTWLAQPGSSRVCLAPFLANGRLPEGLSLSPPDEACSAALSIAVFRASYLDPMIITQVMKRMADVTNVLASVFPHVIEAFYPASVTKLNAFLWTGCTESEVRS